MITCSCGRSVLKKGMNRHLQTSAHLNALNSLGKEPISGENNIKMEFGEETDNESEQLLQDEDYGIEDLN